MKVDLKKLREAVKEFNQSKIWEGILDKKLNPIQRFDVLKERFMEAVELIPEEKEDELPDLVVDVYNALVDMEEAESGQGQFPQSEGKAEGVEELVRERDQEPGQVGSRKRQFGPVLAKLKELVDMGTFTKGEVVSKLCEFFPGRKKTTIQTYVSDSMNPKYCKFERVVVEKDGCLVWEDRK